MAEIKDKPKSEQILLAEKRDLLGKVDLDKRMEGKDPAGNTVVNPDFDFTLGRDGNGIYYDPNGQKMSPISIGNTPLPSEKYVEDKIAEHNTAPDAHAEKFQAVFDEISKLGSVLNYKGSKKTYAELPTVNKVGDVWYVEERSTGYVWIEKGDPAKGEWEEFGPTIDLSGYATKGALEGHINADNPHGITIDKIGAAPAGFGLGMSGGEYCDDYNKAINCGFYTGGGGTLHAPTKIDYGAYSSLLVVSRGNTSDLIQICFVNNGVSIVTEPIIFVRGANVKSDTREFTEWECFNPPMVSGVEYRTTERYEGKPVYIKCMNFGALPNNTTKTVYFIEPYSLLDKVVGHGCYIGNPDYTLGTAFLPYLFGDNDQIWDEIVQNEYRIKTTADRSDMQGVFWVKYTKRGESA